jgi:hypothetical protein
MPASCGGVMNPDGTPRRSVGRSGSSFNEPLGPETYPVGLAFFFFWASSVGSRWRRVGRSGSSSGVLGAVVAEGSWVDAPGLAGVVVEAVAVESRRIKCGLSSSEPASTDATTGSLAAALGLTALAASATERKRPKPYQTPTGLSSVTER